MTSAAFSRMVMGTSGEKSREVAKRATVAVFHALRDRLTPNEADPAQAQLPRELKQVWADGAVGDRAPLKLSREEFLQRVKAEAKLGSRRDARWMTLAVFAALKEHLTPKDLKELWAEAQVEIGAE